MNNRRIPLYVGLALALGTGLLLLNYLTQLQRPTSATRSVVVALSDIPARSRLKPELFSATTRQAAQVDPDALSDPRAVVGKIALITIPAGSVVTVSKVGTAPELALPIRLTRGLRAVSLAVDRVKGVSGLIQPGDRVDVIAAPPRAGNGVPKSSTVLRGILVLAVGSATETASATPPPSTDNTTITLALTPQQANLLVLADTNATIRLALRSPQENTRAFPPEPLDLQGTQEAQSGPAPGPAPAPMVAAPAPAVVGAERPAPPPPPLSKWAVYSVPILDGDRFVTNPQGSR